MKQYSWRLIIGCNHLQESFRMVSQLQWDRRGVREHHGRGSLQGFYFIGVAC